MVATMPDQPLAKPLPGALFNYEANIGQPRQLITGSDPGVTWHGMQGYWPLNEGSGLLANNVWGGIWGSYGLLSGNAKFGPGRTTTGVSFDGTSGVCQVQTVTGFTFAGAASICVWFYVIDGTGADVSNLVALVNNIDAPGTHGYTLDYRTTDNKIDFYIANNGGFGVENFSTGTVPFRGWHFVAATYDGATKAIYIDGSLDSTFASTVNGANTGSNLTFGRRSSGSSRFLNGYIDQVILFNRALRSEEVALLQADPYLLLKRPEPWALL